VENIRRTNRPLIIKHIISEHNINRWRKQIRYLNIWTKQQPFSRQLAFEKIMTNSRIFLSFLFSWSILIVLYVSSCNLCKIR
jgi:hypothetical protein